MTNHDFEQTGLATTIINPGTAPSDSAGTLSRHVFPIPRDVSAPSTDLINHTPDQFSKGDSQGWGGVHDSEVANG